MSHTNRFVGAVRVVHTNLLSLAKHTYTQNDVEYTYIEAQTVFTYEYNSIAYKMRILLMMVCVIFIYQAAIAIVT